MLHGIRSHAGWYEASAERLCDIGFSVLQVDRRGAGRNRRARGHADWPFRLLNDVHRAVEWLRRRTGFPQVHLVGISWGGRLAAAYYVSRPQTVSRLFLVTPGLFPSVDVEFSKKCAITAALLSYRRFRFDIPLNDAEFFTTLPDPLRFIEDDPHQLLRTTAGFFLTSAMISLKARKLLRAPPVPLYLYLAALDPIIDNERTKRFVRSLRWPTCTVTTYARSKHTLELDADRDVYLDDLAAHFEEGIPAKDRNSLAATG